MLHPTKIEDGIEFEKKHSEGSDGVCFLISLPKNHPYFDGHFDDFALFPGVAQVELVIRALSLELQKNVKINFLKKAKFLKFIPPGVQLHLTLKINSVNEAVWELRLGPDTVSKGMLKYE